jgi:hypothetical protein
MREGKHSHKSSGEAERRKKSSGEAEQMKTVPTAKLMEDGD